MARHVVRFQHRGRIQWGVLRERRITPIPGDFATTGDSIRGTTVSRARRARAATAVDVADVAILSPVTQNQQFVCQGANYRQHMIESGMDPDAKTFNMIFTKAASCIVPADSDVVRPKDVRFLDYEIELGLVLRRDIRGPVDVTDANLHEFIAGAVIVNDYSARDVQIPADAVLQGKAFARSGRSARTCALLDAERHRAAAGSSSSR